MKAIVLTGCVIIVNQGCICSNHKAASLYSFQLPQFSKTKACSSLGQTLLSFLDTYIAMDSVLDSRFWDVGGTIH